jgi:MSHA biogenesis protein MshO
MQKFALANFHNRIGAAGGQRGFTLVEMVAVIVLLSFGMIGGVQLFRTLAQSYRDTATRMQLTQNGRFVMQRISRELREALPGSIRVTAAGGTQCIEWLPIFAASRYFSLPATNNFPVMEITPKNFVTGTAYFAVIFPVASDLYVTTNSPLNRLAAVPINAAGESDLNTDQIYLQGAPNFTSSSTSDRIFFTTTPVAICVQGGNMLRHENYGFVAQATTLTGGVLLAENVLQTDGGTPVTIFNFAGATLTRNATVELNIRMGNVVPGEVIRMQQTVFVRNAP